MLAEEATTLIELCKSLPLILKRLPSIALHIDSSRSRFPFKAPIAEGAEYEDSLKDIKGV